MATSSLVKFFYEVNRFTLRDRRTLQAFIERLFRREGKTLESLNYIFVSDKRLLSINRDFLKHDFYTDIITFDLSSGPAISGEIYISIDRVRDNAKTLNQTFSSELHRVIFHGALHLCGYKDKSPADIKTMRAKEEACLTAYFS